MLRRFDGFTVTELLVVMVILVILMALVVPTIFNVFDSSQKSKATNAASATVVAAVHQFEADVRSARSPARDPIAMSELRAFRAAVQSGAGMMNGVSDVRDIVLATPSELWMRTDAVPERRGSARLMECVGYVVTAQGLTRSVSSNWQSCPSGTAGEVVAPAPPQGLTASNVFSYALLVNPTAGATLDPNATCTIVRNVTRPLAAGNRRVGEVIAVSIDLRGFVRQGKTYGAERVASETAIRSRAESEYLYALGCEHS